MSFWMNNQMTWKYRIWNITVYQNLLLQCLLLLHPDDKVIDENSIRPNVGGESKIMLSETRALLTSNNHVSYYICILLKNTGKSRW